MSELCFLVSEVELTKNTISMLGVKSDKESICLNFKVRNLTIINICNSLEYICNVPVLSLSDSFSDLWKCFSGSYCSLLAIMVIRKSL